MKGELIRTGYSGTGLLLAFAAGAAVGTIAALLLAPAPGEETRRRVREAARDMPRKAREFVERMPGEAEEPPLPEEIYAEPAAAAH